MSLTPVIYVDNETVIGAENLNAIQDAILANESAIANKVSTSDYNPSAKTSAMTQEVGKDPNGKLWTEPSGGGTGLIIKGYYPTLQALQQAVPNPSLGDAYGVGASAPYTIYIWDNTQWVNNGTLKGEKGDDGFSPAVTITQTQAGHDVTITDEEHPSGQTFSVTNGVNGTDGEDGEDGYSPSVTISQTATGHNVTITDETHPQGQTFAVDNGTNGQDGEDGDDGYSPVITITQITGGHRVTITDEAHPQGQSFDVMDGTGSVDSVNGQTGVVVLDGADINVDDTEQSPTTVKDKFTEQSSQIASLNTTVGQHTTAIANKSDKATSFTVALDADDWDATDNTLTITDARFVVSGFDYVVTPTSASFTDYASAQICAYDVTVASQMTFHAETVPTDDLTVNIMKVVVS